MPDHNQTTGKKTSRSAFEALDAVLASAEEAVLNRAMRDKEWQRCIAATLADHLERIDLAVFNYPRILNAAGELRAALSSAIRELKDHANA